MGAQGVCTCLPVDFASQYTGFEPQNVWSGRKHLGSIDYLNVPIVANVDWTTFRGNVPHV